MAPHTDTAASEPAGTSRQEVRAEADSRVCVGAVAGAQGVRGDLRIKPFTADPADVAAYGPVTDETGGRRLTLTVREVRKDVVIVSAPEVTDRSAAEALRGVRLYVPRAALPDPEEDEFYHADLIGLAVMGEDGTRYGTVRALYDFGAGEVLEVARAEGGQPFAVPFTREVVPVVDPAGGRVVIVPPPGLLDPPRRERSEEGEGDGETDDREAGQ